MFRYSEASYFWIQVRVFKSAGSGSTTLSPVNVWKFGVMIKKLCHYRLLTSSSNLTVPTRVDDPAGFTPVSIYKVSTR